MNRQALVTAALIGLVTILDPAGAADPPAGSPGPATQPAMPADPADEFQGDYEGQLAGPFSGRVEAKVVAEGLGHYLAVVPMPYKPWGQVLVLRGKQDGEKVRLTGDMPVRVVVNSVSADSDRGTVHWNWTATIEKGRLTAEGKGGRGAGTLDLKRVMKKSPTEGARPPAGAVVLLPYEPGKPTSLDEWTNKNWKILPDGSIEIAKGANRTVRKFGDCRLHVEFRVPYMPDARGQARGNSGVYLQNRYELQVLDSFGLAAVDNGCGGLYKVAAPKVNASFPPLSWQTYDITFRAPRLDEAGKMVAPAEITVEHNGVLIHDKVALKAQTGGGAAGAAAADVIMLQDHGNPVRFRNIWLVELKDEPPAEQTPPAGAGTTPDLRPGLVALAEAAGRDQLRLSDLRPAPNPANEPASQPADSQPDAAGFRDLFNGRDLAGWTCKPGSWAVEDGELVRKGGGYIWSADPFGDFVLELEFKIAKGSNSGVFFRTANLADPVQTGIELQVYDTFGKPPTRNSCGAIYDCLAPSRNVEKEPGQWNRVVLTCRGPKITVVMNGEPIIDMDLDRWTEPRKNPDGSPNKFKTAYKDMPRKGHIGFQDHGNPVWFRNVRIKTLE